MEIRAGAPAARPRPSTALTADVCLTMTAQDVFHPVFQLQLALLEGDFFELFGFGEVMLGSQFVQAIFQFVMLGREIMKFLVGPHQLFLQILRLCIHTPPPWTWLLIPRQSSGFKVNDRRRRDSRATAPARLRPAWCSSRAARPRP